MLSGRKISHAIRKITGGVCGQGRLQSGIILHLMCCLVVDIVIEGLDGNGCYTLGYAISSSAENS